MKYTFNILPYKAGDEHAIQAGFAEVFPSYRSLETWHWIYSNNPDGACIMLAWADNGELAAHYACTVHRAIWAGKQVNIGQIRDVFSIPTYRSKASVFVQTFEAFIKKWTGTDKLTMLFGFPSERPFRLGKLLMRYQAFSNWYCYRYTLFSELQQHTPLGMIHTPKRFDAAFDRLWEKRAKQYSFAICRTANFLNWRFIDNPNNKYWIWTFFSFLSKDILGYVVITATKPEAKLVDFYLPEDPQLAHSFWQQIIDILRWRGIKTIETWFSHQQPAIEALGFKPYSIPNTIIPVFRSFHSDLDSQWLDKHFYYTMADSDLV